MRSGIIHRSSRNRLPRWGNKELRNAVSMRESSERLTSQAETNSGMEFGSNPHQHRQAPKLRHSIHRERWTDARILAPDFLISLPSNRRVIPARQPLRSCFQSKHHVHPRSIKTNYLPDKFSLKKGKKWPKFFLLFLFPPFFLPFINTATQTTHKERGLRRIYESIEAVEERTQRDLSSPAEEFCGYRGGGGGKGADNDFNIRLINYPRLGRVKRSEHSCV